jgi:DNA-binding HxlR family transcriptional regulator
MKSKPCRGQFACPVEASLDVIGGKWKCVILYHLRDGTKRFNELMRLMPDVTQRMLTRQLRELEADQVVTRTVYPEVPPRVEYALTEYGKTLEPILKMLFNWGEEYIGRINGIRDGSG